MAAPNLTESLELAQMLTHRPRIGRGQMGTFCMFSRQRKEKLGFQTHKTESLCKSNSQETRETKVTPGQIRDSKVHSFLVSAWDVENGPAYLPWLAFPVATGHESPTQVFSKAT